MPYYKKTSLIPDNLHQKFELYKKLSINILDQYGWLGNDPDHSLEFTSLYYAVIKLEGNPISLCQDKNGMFYRHPSQVGKTLEELKIRSTISRDMFIGLMWYILLNKRIDICDNVIKYAHKHFFKMGNYITTEHLTTKNNIKKFCYKYIPFFLTKYFDKLAKWLSKYEGITRVYFSPGLYFTYRGIKAYLKNKKYNFWIHIPTYFSKGQIGFRANLTALHIAIRGQIRGYLTKHEMNVAKDLADRHPENALFQALYHKYLDGDQTKTIEILMKENLFPSERLPTSKDRATYWLWSYPENSLDWKPSKTENIIHSGIDLLFVKILLEL